MSQKTDVLIPSTRPAVEDALVDAFGWERHFVIYTVTEDGVVVQGPRGAWPTLQKTLERHGLEWEMLSRVE